MNHSADGVMASIHMPHDDTALKSSHLSNVAWLVCASSLPDCSVFLNTVSSRAGLFGTGQQMLCDWPRTLCQMWASRRQSGQAAILLFGCEHCNNITQPPVVPHPRSSRRNAANRPPSVEDSRLMGRADVHHCPLCWHPERAHRLQCAAILYLKTS